MILFLQCTLFFQRANGTWKKRADDGKEGTGNPTFPWMKRVHLRAFCESIVEEIKRDALIPSTAK
jgi:hypothetical protein